MVVALTLIPLFFSLWFGVEGPGIERGGMMKIGPVSGRYGVAVKDSHGGNGGESGKGHFTVGLVGQGHDLGARLASVGDDQRLLAINDRLHQFDSIATQFRERCFHWHNLPRVGPNHKRIFPMARIRITHVVRRKWITTTTSPAGQVPHACILWPANPGKPATALFCHLAQADVTRSHKTSRKLTIL